MGISFADAIFWVAVLSCVVAQAAITRSALRMRGDTQSGSLPRPRVVTEVAWVIVPAIALAIVLFMTWRAIHPPSGAPTHEHALIVVHPSV
jgi:heme/copper-type cytochrome/quinol oxidase subunit 2